TDDSSNSFGSAVALNGVTSIPPGASVIFLETADNNAGTISAKKAAFLSVWFGANPPANLQVGTYSGAGIGLSTGGDAINLFNAAGVVQARVDFNTSPAGPLFPTFDNGEGQNNVVISALSAAGINGAFRAVGDNNEIGSPGTIGASTTPIITIAAIDPTAAEAGSDPGTFRITRTGSTISALTVNYSVITGSGQATGSDFTVPLAGFVTIAAGQSFADLVIVPADDIFLEGDETVTISLFDTGSYDIGTPAAASVIITDDVQLPALQGAITVTRSGFVLDRRTNTFVQTDKLTNTSASAIPGPLFLVLDNLSANATLPERAGNIISVAPTGSPYVQVVGPAGSLAPGASVSTALGFANPTRAGITYTTRVLAGGNITP
ncbi:MAG: putative outer rane adhesin like protein, partial [Chthoniobacteraceae bacterium]|nr:putative outer rane adhesin like protein [Chthoniobacteraceae bacterium]